MGCGGNVETKAGGDYTSMNLDKKGEVFAGREKPLVAEK